MSKRVAVKLNSKAERLIQSGHPWVFSDSVEKINDNAETGDLAIVFSRSKNRLIAIGIYDADSPIKIKIIHHGSESVIIDSQFFKDRINVAFIKRLKLLETNTSGYRLIFGENDGFPGLIADVYEDVLVIKLYSEIWFPFLEGIIDELIRLSNCKTAVLRLSRLLQKKPSLGYEDGKIIRGSLQSEVVQFMEHGINFSANVIKGHKTGYFLDHRENRRLVGQLSKGKTVLDVFCYAGGFSVHALSNGAKKVTGIDISEKALLVAKDNVNLNKYEGIYQTISGDAFQIMKDLIRQRNKYDVVVIDPPSFAKRNSEVELAKKKYKQLAEVGIELTASSGILVLASCSSRVSAQAFFDINSQVLKSQKRPFHLLRKTFHDVDHPINFPEGAYLKCVYYEFLD